MRKLWLHVLLYAGVGQQRQRQPRPSHFSDFQLKWGVGHFLLRIPTPEENGTHHDSVRMTDPRKTTPRQSDPLGNECSNHSCAEETADTCSLYKDSCRNYFQEWKSKNAFNACIYDMCLFFELLRWSSKVQTSTGTQNICWYYLIWQYDLHVYSHIWWCHQSKMWLKRLESHPPKHMFRGHLVIHKEI